MARVAAMKAISTGKMKRDGAHAWMGTVQLVLKRVMVVAALVLAASSPVLEVVANHVLLEVFPRREVAIVPNVLLELFQRFQAALGVNHVGQALLQRKAVHTADSAHKAKYLPRAVVLVIHVMLVALRRTSKHASNVQVGNLLVRAATHVRIAPQALSPVQAVLNAGAVMAAS